MATTTTNLGLTKPATSDSVSIAVLDANLDALDAAVGAHTGDVSVATVANSTTETVVMAHTIKGGTPAIGRAYKVVCWGQASVTGTPTLTFRLRIGGLTGALLGSIVVTAASGVSSKPWRACGEAICVTTGSSGTWLGAINIIDEINSTLPNAADVNVITSAVTKDTTADEDLVITVQWSAASASNTCSTYAGYGRQEA